MRRSVWLHMAALAVIALGVCRPAHAAPFDTSGAKKLGWRLALQAWTNNQATLYETLELAQRVGLHCVEAFPGQRLTKDAEGAMGPDMTEEQIKALLAKAKACDVTIPNYGVTGIPGDEPGARKVFEWAKKIGIETLNAEPGEDQIPLLDKLATEFDMRIGIHNHPKPSHYAGPDTVLAAVKGASPRIGSCADTGHWVRSGLDPVECLKQLEGRIESFHFKGVFSIEYEYKWDEATLAKCAEFFYAEAKKLAAK